MLASLEWLRSPYNVLDRALERGCLTFWHRIPSMGNSLLTGDPAVVEEVVKDRALIGGRGTEALRPVVGDYSLIALEGEPHARHRAIMLPLFFSVDGGIADALTKRWTCRMLDALPVGSIFSAHTLAANINLNIMMELMFGELPADVHRQGVELVDTWMRSFEHSIVLFLKPLHVNLGTKSPWGRFLGNRSRVHQFVRERIRRCGQEGAGGLLTDILAGARKEPAWSENELASELITFLLFGHDTSAAALAWTFGHLLSHADALAAVTSEARLAATEALDQLPLLTSATHESLRLTPVVVHLTRHAIADTAVGGHTIPAGTKVLPSAYLAHRNPEMFDRPTDYIHDRFLRPKPEWRYAYFPFGLGVRLCAGMPTALQQMVTLLAVCLREARFELVSSGPLQPERSMVLIVPEAGLTVRRVA
jgi:cytochrome P450